MGLDALGVLHLLVVLLLELLSQALVVLRHLLLLKLFPLQVDFSIELLLSAFEPDLLLLFGVDVTEEHLGVKCLDLILTVMEYFVGFIDLTLSE